MASEERSAVERVVEELCGEWEVRVAETDREDAERALREVYDQRGWGRPKAVIWFDSPLAGAIAARTLLYGHAHLHGDPDAYKAWREAATARLEGAFGTFDRQEPSEFEEEQEAAARWRLPEVLSAYKLSYDMSAPDLQAVLGRVGEPAWAVNGAVAVRFQQEALGPGDPGLFAEIGAAAHARLLEGMRPLFPAERWEAVSAALRACADEPRPDHWKLWREVWAAARAPHNHALLILDAARRGDGGPLLRLAPAVGWWWALNDVALLTPPPAEVHTDGSGLLHRADGPAVRYRDGFAQYCWRGQVVPPDLVEPGWSAADIAHASDETLRARAVEQLGTGSYTAMLRAEQVVPDLRRCALARLGWVRFAAEAPLARVGEAVADPGEPGCELALYDVPAAVFGSAARVVLRIGGTRGGTALLVPADATDPVAAASWLGGGVDGAREPAPEPELLARIRRSEPMREALAWLDFEMSHVSHTEHVEEIHLYGGARLEPIGGHGTGGTYFLCGDGPRRPVLYADSEGGYQVLGRDLAEALEFMASADPDGGDPEEADEEAARELGLRLLSPEEYRARRERAKALAAALIPVMTAEGNRYEHRPTTWFRC